jgi:hypothetical protein
VDNAVIMIEELPFAQSCRVKRHARM